MNDELPAADADISAQIAQTERIGLGDFVIVGALALATFFGLCIWGFPGIPPALWDDAAIAAGVRPAVHVNAGYFSVVASIVYGIFGQGFGNWLLKLAGRVALSGIAVLVYAAMREMLVFIMRARPQRSIRRFMVMQLASLVGTVAFIVTDPVWAAGQFLSENTILIGLTLGSLEFYFLFLRKGALKYAYACAALLGLLAAETPMGFVFAAAFVALNFAVLKFLPILESPFFRPEVIAVGKWHMTFIFLAAMVLGVTVDSVTFIAHDGLSAVGKSLGSLPLDFLVGYWGRISHAADMTGWILLLGVCVAPFIVTIMRFPSAADEETFLSYSTGIVFLFCGALAFLQSGPIPELWFWTYAKNISPYLLSLGVLLAAVTLAGSVTILGVDSLCRNHLRLAQQQLGVDDDDDDVPPPVSSRLSNTIRRTSIVVVPSVLLILMLPGRVKSATRAMMDLVNDVVEQMVRECGDAKYLFSDGNLDAAIELESRRQKGDLKCLSLISSGDPYKIYLRTRGLGTDAEDLFSFRIDSAMGLRSWIRDRPEKLKSCAIQLGYDLWKRDGKPIPPVGGILSRPAGWPDEAERRESVAAAYSLAERALAICSRGRRDCTDKATRTAFSCALWRLARACTYRSERADLAGDAKAAIADVELAKRLNDCNEAYKRLLAAITKQSDRMQQQLTTREGLQLALVRADFTMGKMYAETVLSADPDDPDSNFAMGMYYLKERQLSRAEEYLKRCLVRKPNEPAVYNNLAMIQMELGRLDAAEINVQKALKLIPGSAAVLDTQKAIQKAREAKEGKK